MTDEGDDEMVGKLRDKLQAKMKELRKANGKLATQARFLTGMTNLSKNAKWYQSLLSFPCNIPVMVMKWYLSTPSGRYAMDLQHLRLIKEKNCRLTLRVSELVELCWTFQMGEWPVQPV